MPYTIYVPSDATTAQIFNGLVSEGEVRGRYIMQSVKARFLTMPLRAWAATTVTDLYQALFEASTRATSWQTYLAIARVSTGGVILSQPSKPYPSGASSFVGPWRKEAPIA